jgi:hypothetical protein
LTWGVIGFTLKRGEIQDILSAAERRVHDLLPRVMGPLAPQWNSVQRQPLEAQMAWADSISSGPDKTALEPQWQQAFARLGDEPIIKYLQMEKAKQTYFLPAAGNALRLQLRSELGMAFAFDTQVQNGGFTEEVVEISKGFPPGINEMERRRRLAELVAGLCNPRRQTDVYKRKMVLATGSGEMRNRQYRLTAWGINESPVS